MTTVDLPATFAPIPHGLILTQAAPHVRLYGVLHYLGWERRPFEAADLAAMLDTSERSVYRWLDALAAAGWLTYDRQPGKRGLGERISLYTSTADTAATSDTSVRGAAQPLTPGSEDPPTSDTRIRGSAQPLTPGSEASDPGVRGSHETTHQGALDDGTQIRTQTPDSDPESSTTTVIPDRPLSGGGGGPHRSSSVPPPDSPGAQLLAREGFRAPGIREFGHYPPEVLAADIARMKAEGTKPGGMVLYWRAFPPGTTPPKEPTDAPARRAPPEPGPPAGLKIARARPAAPER